MSDIYIYIDGIDGTGKSTLVKKLKSIGYKNVFDRSILTTLSLAPIDELPSEIISNDKIIDQIKKIKQNFPASELATNRDVMEKLDFSISDGDILDGDILDGDNVIYLILNSSIQTCLDRLKKRETETGIKLNAFDSEVSIKYFHAKYLFIAYRYNIPIIDTENKTLEEVYQLAQDLINNRTIGEIYNYKYHLCANNKFNPHILELEWLHLGTSKIIYADDQLCVHSSNDDFDLECYQKESLRLITKLKLDGFINELKN